MNRRHFVGGAAALLSAPLSFAGTRNGIPTRKFGKTGAELTIVGQAAGRFPLCTFEEAVAVTRRAYDLGINYFDNAYGYWNGRSEEAYGEAMKGWRKDIFLTTKSQDRTRAGAMKQLEESLRRLKTDYVDLWQIHSIQELEELDRIFAPGGAIEAFAEAKRQGKARFIGFTGHRDPHVHAAMLKRGYPFDTILMPLHAADPAYLSFEKIVLPEAIRQGLGIQAMKTTANAKLLSIFNVRQCLEYVLSLPGVAAATLGATTIGQIEDDVRIAKSFKPLDAAMMSSLRERAAKIQAPGFEDWKRNVEQRAGIYAYVGG